MRRTLTAAAILAVTVVWLVWLFLPPEAKARIIAYYDIAQTWPAPQTFAPTSSVAVPGTTGAGLYFKRDVQVAGTAARFEGFNATPGVVSTAMTSQIRTTTPTIGDGAAFNLELFDSSGSVWAAGQMRAVATDVTDGSEDGYLEWWTSAAGTVAGRMRLDQTGLMGASGGVLLLPVGANLTGGNLSVAAAQKVNLEGPSGDTHLTRTAATASADFTLDGTLGWSVIGGMLQPPSCPADLNLAPPGFCYDAAGARTVLVGVLETYP